MDKSQLTFFDEELRTPLFFACDSGNLDIVSLLINEKAKINTTKVTADKNPSYSTSPGNNTTDKVFLLSITEVNQYFSSDSVRQCQGTAYCYALGAYKASNGNCWWWLRSPGFHSHSAARVNYFGSVYLYGNLVHHDDDAVRPALWINLGS